VIKNFNFYDVYGYFLPGFTLLALIWLPFGMCYNLWPQAELSSALVAVIFGYIAGHFLQIFAAPAIPSTIKETWKRRFPSEILLDADDDTFSPGFKEVLKARIVARFGKKFSSHPQDAFFQCRSFLVQHKAASYVEQAEAMYVFMRGLTAAFALGAIYHTGWALAGWFAGWGRLICIVAGAAMFLSIVAALFSLTRLRRVPVPGLLKWLTDRGQGQVFSPPADAGGEVSSPPAEMEERVQVHLRKSGLVRDLLIGVFTLSSFIAACYFGSNRWSWFGVGIGLAGAFFAILIPEFRKSPKGIRISFLDLVAWVKVAPVVFVLLALGYSSGLTKEISLSQRSWLIGIALISLFASSKFYSSYLYFAEDFAAKTYRDFVAYEESKTGRGSGGGEEEGD
jgi:hypothetical protein